MFKTGDKIVYPNQGVGIIDLIEEKEFRGETQKFYNIHLLNNSLKITLPCNRIENSSIRLICDSNTLDNILDNLKRLSEQNDAIDSTNSKDRFLTNSAKVKSGSLQDYIEVFLNLSLIKRSHSLNSSENQMLNTIKKVLIEEISLVKNITDNEANDLLEKNLSL
ncbi:CarD family transcriptional regulator [Clostridium sp. SHJSY1]|uniref:CarD family transcriptional regulator n=1 Tax=Clostridium sp. SHJSY1 TaxID=2942483 RepID=UPI002876F483|nr:CarD family transcriptional regulator [Clostridium sp. SHJSY1]MDS0527025.1 CarD family transcriptional regulator [Clostridium sp. SHJSY1]